MSDEGDLIPVEIKCRKLHREGEVGGCVGCECYRGVYINSTGGVYVKCKWEAHQIEKALKKLEEDHEKELEKDGNKRIGAAAMQIRMNHTAPKDTENFNKGQFIGSIPNPGSDEAKDLGCLCPVLDNAHGKGIDLDGGLFWINQTCPLHGGATDRSIGRKLMKDKDLKKKG
jgi:hypothetical protein